MKCRSIIPLSVVGTMAIVNPSSANAQEFTGRVNITTYSLGMQELFSFLDGKDVATIMDLPVDAIRTAVGVRIETQLAKVRGTVIHTAMDEDEMIVNYETGRFTMYDSANDVHATWTGDELKEKMAAMMGGGPAGPGGGRDIASMMAQARGAMGIKEESPKGPYSLNRQDDCGDWWGGNMGTVSLEGNPMQPGWMLQICVTKNNPAAWRSFKAMNEAMGQFDMMGDENAEDKMETAILEHGMPAITKRLSKGGGMTPSIEFQLTVLEVTPGPVSADEVKVKGRKITLEEFMGMKMRGMR